MGSPDQCVSMAPAVPLDELLARQREDFRRCPDPDRATRDGRLQRLGRLLLDNADAIAGAISADFGHRSPRETRLLEIFPSLESIRFARRHLATWMRPQRRPVSLWFQFGRARVVIQPLGVVGIIAPWNYPILLAVAPMVGALAAGNRVMVKMSELAPRTAALFADLASAVFAPEEVAVVQGDALVGQAFSQMPFDHLLFTGSARVGHAVMRAAAENLTPVTLELGGKSPAIIGPDYPLARAAERILVGKTLNAGQTCIAPDYVLLPAGKTGGFLDAAQKVVNACYPRLAANPDYTTIVSDTHFARLMGLLDDARTKGARVVPLAAAPAEADAARRFLPPLALTGVRDDMAIMREEIFGPLLPIVEYKTVDDAVAYVAARPRPLALYLFEDDPGRIDRVLRHTHAGGVTINDTILHIAQDSLPFGGVGTSGMGRYHGREGFETFSHHKAVFHQSRLNALALFKPPYGRVFDALIRALLR
ncbi:MAG: coniferyl aldehyde dehydrogenase [Rhodocyclaceae bacterium]